MLNSLVDAEWLTGLENILNAPSTQELTKFLEYESRNFEIAPRQEHYFRAINRLAPQNVRVVILGQDPYHGEGQAEGLAFSVPQHSKIPPSLHNIFKELAADFSDQSHIAHAENGHLGAWVDQGVLLLNSVLSTRIGEAGAHANKGWEEITNEIIRICNDGAPKVFILWGKYAQEKAKFIDNQHHIIASAHPSPLSAYRGFWGSKPFSRANAFLQEVGFAPIDWLSVYKG